MFAGQNVWLIVMATYWHMHISFPTMAACEVARQEVIKHQPAVCLQLNRDTMIQ